MPAQQRAPSYLPQQHQLQPAIGVVIDLYRRGNGFLCVLVVYPARFAEQLLDLRMGRSLRITPVQKRPIVTDADIQPVQHPPSRRLQVGKQREEVHGLKADQFAVKAQVIEVLALFAQLAVPAVDGCDLRLGLRQGSQMGHGCSCNRFAWRNIDLLDLDTWGPTFDN